MEQSAETLKSKSLKEKRLSLKEKISQSDFVLEQMALYLKDGDIASLTDLIALPTLQIRLFTKTKINSQAPLAQPDRLFIACLHTVIQFL